MSGSAPGVRKTYQPYYDILYLLAYRRAAVDPTCCELTGTSLVKYGLRKMVPGPNIPKVEIGSQGIYDATAKLSSGTAIDIAGASGPLNFDQYGEAQSDIQIWCVPPGAAPNAAGPVINSGRYFDSGTGKMTGAFSSECALP